MNDNEVQLARKKYNQLIEKRNKKIREQETRMEEITNNSKVDEYIILSNEVSEEGKNKSKNRVIEESFDEFAKNTKENANIYVFLGYYGTNSQDCLSPIAENNPYARYKYYANLETTSITVVDRKKCSEFENNNVVIFLDEEKNYHHIGFYREKYNELRNKYFEYLITNSQEESIKQITKKR